MPRDKSRWVLTQKAPGLVRARLVAKDFAHGRPSALDLGLSSNTASVEALKLILSRAAKGRHADMGAGHLYCVPVCECCPTHRGRTP